MNGRIAKKIRKLTRRNYINLIDELLHLSFRERLYWAFYVVRHHLKPEEHVSYNSNAKDES